MSEQTVASGGAVEKTHGEELTEREKRLAEIAAWAKSINDRERERRLRYLLSALSSDQLPHVPKSTASTSTFLARRFGKIL